MSSRRRKKGLAGNPVWTAVMVLLIVMAVWVALSPGSSASEEPTQPRTDNAGSMPPATELEKVMTPRGLPQQILPKTGFTISFNPETRQPNYVAWELLGSETEGGQERTDLFSPDPAAKESATPDDYRYSGYDRGHMAPAGDMKWNARAMEESFLMTNICPQDAALNRGAWKKLEEKCRAKALADSAVIVVCGPIFDTPQPRMRIGNSGVAVPDRFFKVILSPYTDPVQAIGFIMPNDEVKGGMQPCAVSVDEVERITGYDFFSALPDSIENAAEASCNFNRWSHTKRRRDR